MARTLDQAKRLEIASGALVVLRERGLRNTSMTDLAKALGIKRPTLYWYFKNLDEIFVFYLTHFRAMEAAWVAEQLQGVTDPIDLLDTFVRAELKFFVEHGAADFMVLLCQFWGSGDPQTQAQFQRLTTKGVDAIRFMLVGAVQMGIDQGTVRPVDPNALVDLMLTYMDGALIGGVMHDRDAAPLADFLTEHLLNPLRISKENA